MTPNESARGAWVQTVLDAAFGTGAAILGCTLLVAGALHLIASSDVRGDATVAPVAFHSAPRTAPRNDGKAVAHVRERPQLRPRVVPRHRAIAKPVVRHAVAVLIFPRRRAPALAAVLSRPHPLPHPHSKQVARVAGRRPLGLPEPPLGYRAQPSLIGVSGDALAVAPRLAGLKMRGRILDSGTRP